MCGIAGIIGNGQFSKADVGRMVESIAYRGPDEQGVVEVGPALLGHARLAVVDPENGGQPMSNMDDTVWVVFNGEIYNFVEIREDLKAKGYVFKSRCDTEVLVHLWREKGVAMLQDLIGMFAFCLWDTKQNCGLLVRDRQGIKPCYLMDLPGGGFAFASEIKALLSLPGIKADIDDVGVNMMHSFNYCPPPRTCYKGVTHLAPGTCLEIKPDGTRTSHKYWHWPLTTEKQDLSADALSALLDDAIRLQMRFDVDGCLFLSGGVDSSVIAAHLMKQWNRPKLLAFGLDCREEGFGEFHLAQTVAKRFSMIDLHPISYDNSIVPDNIEAILHHADQPHGDFSFFLIRKLCEAAHAAGVIVAFNGDGPDELLSGFSHNQEFFTTQTRTNFALGDYFKRICFMPDASRERLLNDDFRAQLDKPIEAFEELLTDWRHLDPIDQIVAYECTSLAPGNNLIKTDRMGAGLSIEGRSPFLDHRMTEAFSKVPQNQKLQNSTSKYLLKDYGTRFFDREFMFRKKSMPTMPIGEWVKGPLYGWARETLSLLDPSRYSVPAALQMLDEHRLEKANYTRELRTLFMSAVWMQKLAH